MTKINFSRLTIRFELCIIYLLTFWSSSLSIFRDNSISFLVLGDWGGLPLFPYKTFVESAVAKGMGEIAARHGIEYIMALGDNFYFDGVNNVSDPRFNETYESVFTAKSLFIPWFVIAGNHDHHHNVTAQVQYTKYSKRWYFPSLYYNLKFYIPNSNTTLELLMIDTIVLCGNNDIDFVGQPPKGPANVKEAEDQWSWIENILSKSNDDYILVAGHFPVWSISEHGPTRCLVKRLLPMLHKYRVNAYLCGHDHNLQHIEYQQWNWTVNYFVSGASNFIELSLKHKKDIPPNSLKFFWADTLSLGGFGIMDINYKRMIYSFLDTRGKILHSKTMYSRKCDAK